MLCINDFHKLNSSNTSGPLIWTTSASVIQACHAVDPGLFTIQLKLVLLVLIANAPKKSLLNSTAECLFSLTNHMDLLFACLVIYYDETITTYTNLDTWHNTQVNLALFDYWNLFKNVYERRQYRRVPLFIGRATKGFLFFFSPLLSSPLSISFV